jgi:hypothetical protein
MVVTIDGLLAVIAANPWRLQQMLQLRQPPIIFLTRVGS